MDPKNIPVGVSLTLVQNEDTTSYTGMTREQKRELLTHALIARAGESVIPYTAADKEKRL